MLHLGIRLGHCLAFLANLVLPNYMNALTLVWLNRMIVANRCSRLAYELLIDAFNLELGASIADGDCDSVGNVIINIVRKA